MYIIRYVVLRLAAMNRVLTILKHVDIRKKNKKK